MILLDTSVMSETSKPAPNPRVRAWLDATAPSEFVISAITIAELTLGLALLPEGRRKATIAHAVGRIIDRYGRSSIPFDVLAAHQYAIVVMSRRAKGRPIQMADAQIAAIALASGCTLATLNPKDFEGIEGLTLVDPGGA